MLRIDASVLDYAIIATLFLAWGFTRPLVDELEQDDVDAGVTGAEPQARARP